MSVQDHFTPLDSETSDVTESQAEDPSTEEPNATIPSHSEVSNGNDKKLLQQHIETQLNTMPMQMKSQN